jgi:hypothetical protein
MPIKYEALGCSIKYVGFIPGHLLLNKFAEFVSWIEVQRFKKRKRKSANQEKFLVTRQSFR